MLLLADCVFAQSIPITMVGTGTLTNADTVALTQTVNGVYNTISVQVVTTKYSGTLTGTAILQGSVDGTNYVNINTDTLTFTTGTTNTKVWVLEGTSFKYYKVNCITTGTVSAQAKA